MDCKLGKQLWVNDVIEIFLLLQPSIYKKNTFKYNLVWKYDILLIKIISSLIHKHLF